MLNAKVTNERCSRQNMDVSDIIYFEITFRFAWKYLGKPLKT
jgi:hypothetical protein